jgi:hypothetical protein
VQTTPQADRAVADRREPDWKTDLEMLTATDVLPLALDAHQKAGVISSQSSKRGLHPENYI